MNGLTSEKTEMCGSIAGVIGMLCFLLPFFRVQFLGVSESYSALNYVFEFFSGADSDDITVILWIVGAFAAGIVGVSANYVVNGTLFSGISFVVGLICLYIMKDFCISAGYGLIQMGAGWTLAFIAYIVAAACAFATLYLAGKEAEKQKDEPAFSNISDDTLTKLRDELAHYRAQDDDKK